MLKLILAIIASFGVVISLLWLMVGGTALAIGLGVFFLVVVIFAAFGVGSWWSGKLMERGARIALQAQTSDDRRDMVQMRAMSGLAKEMLRLRGEAQKKTGFPALAAGEDLVEGMFTVSGLEEDMDN
jgi:hypothetical protein